MEWQTIGHECIRGVLERQLSGGRVAQAYLFVGPFGVGKHTLALEFARKIIQATHADEQPLEFSFAESNLEQVRELIHRLSLRPQAGSRQVAVLDAAETMSGPAANALLKTIEEPTASTVLIFISSRDNALATIRSRCQVFQFSRLSAAHMNAWAQSRGFGPEQEVALMAADGSPGQFFIQLQPPTSTQWVLYCDDFYRLMHASLSERLSFIGRWAAEDAEMLSARIAAWLTIVYTQPALCTEVTKVLSVLLEAWRRLQTNANKKLVLEYVCINIV